MKQVNCESLFSPFALNHLKLRNRFVMAPMTRKRSPNGTPDEAVATYYKMRGEGGIGLIFTEGTFVDHPSAQAYAPPSYENIPTFHGDAALRGWEKVRKTVHATGAKIIPQLWHVGDVRRLGMEPFPQIPGFGPVDIEEFGNRTVKAMTPEDVETVASAYARSAHHARELGFDGVAIHGAHGYLIDQFLWSAHNTRQDEYGGDMEARCLPGCHIIRAIRSAIGPDFPIIFRFSQWKMTDYDARIAETADDLTILLRAFKEAGVDIFDASTRRFWEPAFDDEPASLAAWTKRLSGCPTIAVGSIGLDQPHQSKYFRAKAQVNANVTDLENVVTALNQGDFDLAAVGRALLADPNWVNKVADNRMKDIIPFERAHLDNYL